MLLRTLKCVRFTLQEVRKNAGIVGYNRGLKQDPILNQYFLNVNGIDPIERRKYYELTMQSILNWLCNQCKYSKF